MRQSTLVTVMVHQGAVDAIRRHRQYWEHQSPNVIYICPKDSIVEVPGFQVFRVGKKCHDGAEAINRFRYILTFLKDMGYERHQIYEYDSLCLGDFPEYPEDCLAANWFPEPHPSESFKAGHFCHPPLACTNDVLNRICEAMKPVPSTAEKGFWDRWLGLVCQEGNIPRHNFIQHGLGFSHNTIHEAHYPAAREARRKGARVFHGVKDLGALKAITL